MPTAAGLLIVLLTSTPIWAQETAQINGSITDPTGALLPGVEVTATHIDRGTVRTAVSNETGSFVLPNLALGPYTLEASLPGFSTFLQTGIVLQVGASPVINVVLEVGQVAQTIEVQADALMVETRNTGIGQILDNTRVLELPLNGRQVTELIALSGAAITSPTRGTSRNYPTIAVAVGGGQDNGLSYRMDGGTHNDPFNNLNMPLPFPDALQEFKVETSAIPARHGQHSAGLVSVVTKSGTNEFHGSAFEFVRNEVFNARNTFANERDSLKRNQFGGTFGGPIVGDRLFFFTGYQRTMRRSAPSTTFAFVPTAEVLNGDFRQIAGEGCRGAGRGVNVRARRAPDIFEFVDNQIDPALLSPVAKNIAARLPTPTDPCGRIEFSERDNEDEHQWVTRADFQASNSHSMFFRYSIHRLTSPSDYNGTIPVAVDAPNWTRKYQSGVFGDTWSINNNLINSFRVTLIRTANTKSFFDVFTPGEVGVQDFTSPAAPYPKMMIIDVRGAFDTFSQQATPSYTNSTGYEVSNDIGWVTGDHQFAFGGSYMRQLMYISSSSSSPGNWRFRTRGTGLSMADFMIGYVDRFRQEDLATWYPRQDFRSMYAQDTWRATPNFTVNLGLRWEPFTPQVRNDKRTGRFRRDWFDQGRQSTVFVNAPLGYLYSGGDRPAGPGDEGMPADAQISNNLWGHFAPRVGMAWDVSGDGRTSIRAAYGIFYDYPHTYQFNGLRTLTPYTPRITWNRYIGGLDDPWLRNPGGNPIPVIATPDLVFPRNALFMTIDENYKSPYVHQWNLSIQRQIGREWIATANYIGNTSVHLLGIREANPEIDGVRELTSANPESGLAALNKFDDGGTGSYNAMWLSLERQSAGMNLRMNYTWSHSIGDQTSFNSTSSGRPHLSRRTANRGNNILDRRHAFNLSTVYETPQFANSTLRALASGWRASGILKVLSGDFFDVGCDCDRANTDEDDQRAHQLMDNVFMANKSADQYLNPAAFGTPARGTYGNLGRNSIRGPGIFTLDIGLTRSFAIGENQTIEIRAETFNLPNYVNLGNPESIIDDNDFGQITSAGDPRIMQFALKYKF